MKRSALGSKGTAHSFVTARTATLFWQSSLDYTLTPRRETAIGRSQCGNPKQRIAATFMTMSLRRNTRLLHQREFATGGSRNMRLCHQLKVTQFTLSAVRLFTWGRVQKQQKQRRPALR